MKNKYKKYTVKNKRNRIIMAIMCLIALSGFVIWVILWIIWWYKLDLKLMKLWILLSIVFWIFMWILHILCFRMPKKFRKALYGE